jgi:WD40 repeat protein
VFEVAVSVDRAGILEYWTGPSTEYKFPKCVLFESKLDTDLFEFAKSKTYPTGLSFSPDGKIFATLSGDRKVVHSLKFRLNNRHGEYYMVCSTFLIIHMQIVEF